MNSSKKLYKKLDPYQQDATDWAIKVKTAGLFFEQGTGKTWITGGVVEGLWDKNFQALIVVPLTNKESTWLKFLTTHFPRCVFTDYNDFLAAPTPRILLHHFEELTPRKEKRGRMKVDWSHVKSLKKIDWSLIVFDESQRLKERTTYQSKVAGRLAHCAERKMILSGTPIEQQPQDLWAQFRFLRPELFGDNWSDFEDQWLEPINIDLTKYRRGSYQWQRMLRIMQMAKRRRKFDMTKLDDFLELIKPYCLRVTKDVLNLKPLRIKRVEVELKGEQRRVYDDIERDLFAKKDDYRITGAMRVTQIVKLHQVCGGYVYDDDGLVREVGKAKLHATIKLTKKHPRPIVVFCRYLEEVWAVHDEMVDLGYTVETLTGKTKRHLRAPIQDLFQRGKIDVLVCQIKTGGVGIDLFRSYIGIVYSCNYSFIDFDQMLSRLHRRGQRNEVQIFLLCALGTIDEDIYDAIDSKRALTNRVLFHLRRQRYGKESRKEDRQEGRRAGPQVRREQSRQGPRHPRSVRSRRLA